MTITLQDSPSLILVKVPKDAYDFEIPPNQIKPTLLYYKHKSTPDDLFEIILPDGECKLIGKLSDILKDEDLCKECVEGKLLSSLTRKGMVERMWYKNYSKKINISNIGEPTFCMDEKQSLLSRLPSDIDADDFLIVKILK